jgi:AcrR family transcriptional regulator
MAFVTGRVNRRELIIKKAAELFMTQGYTATSVRQIAEAADCTEAALYYHFKDGKRALFQTVLEQNFPDLLGLLDSCRDARSISEVVTSFGDIDSRGVRIYNRLQWIVAEYPNLSTDEQALVQEALLTFHAELTQILIAFEPNNKRAQELSWILLCASFGFAQTFIHLDLRSATGVTPETFMQALAEKLDS